MRCSRKQEGNVVDTVGGRGGREGDKERNNAGQGCSVQHLELKRKVRRCGGNVCSEKGEGFKTGRIEALRMRW